MKAIKYALAILFVAGTISSVWAGPDRFGADRDEIARTSFTDTTDLNVVIASAAANGPGSMVVRGVIFSGMASSTVTFYDASLFTANVTTMSRLEYSPMLSGGGGSGSQPIYVPVDIFISSGVMYSKQGPAPVTIKWDWLTIGEYKGKRGDPRP